MTSRTDACTLPTVSGPCRSHFVKWSYDEASQSCNEFVYGGCQGNANSPIANYFNPILIRYLITSQEIANAIATSAGLEVSMEGGDNLLSNGSFALKSAISIDYNFPNPTRSNRNDIEVTELKIQNSSSSIISVYAYCNGDFGYRRVSPHRLPLHEHAFLWSADFLQVAAWSIMDSVFFQTLLSRASQDDAALQDTEQPSPQLTPARRSSKWDAAERHQSSPSTTNLVQDPVCRPEEHVVVKWPLRQRRRSADQEVVRREALGLGRFDVHLRQRSELTMCSASAAGCGELLREGSSLNVAANAVLIDRTNAPRRHPCSERGSSLFAPTKFVPLSEYITLGVPLRAMNRRKASIMESDDKDSASSICTARVVRHVNSARISFVSAAYRHTHRPEIIDPVHVKGVNVVHDLSSPSVVRFNSFLRPFVFAFAQEIGSVEPSVRFIKVGRRVSCRVISDVQFRRHPPPTFHRRVFLQFGQAMSDKRFERPWVGADQDRTVRESVQNILRVTFNSISVSIDEANRAPNSAACNSSRGIDMTFKGATRAFPAISETALSCSLNFIRQYTAAAYDFSLASTNTCSSPRCGRAICIEVF
ncbi:hypothetical protein EVAR_36039_1 [Eumeta japonica]|uniref:BPTI/Kunitz inhibitor domain-containing protein n=1 Tax=Eumeta variegata TaxID=151549 RepID=A0A4C1WS47_EUMVA|nr:hypothetical protein EVAR_36039_1 [Eumeta japonica]